MFRGPEPTFVKVRREQGKHNLNLLVPLFHSELLQAVTVKSGDEGLSLVINCSKFSSDKTNRFVKLLGPILQSYGYPNLAINIKHGADARMTISGSGVKELDQQALRTFIDDFNEALRSKGAEVINMVLNQHNGIPIQDINEIIADYAFVPRGPRA